MASGSAIPEGLLYHPEHGWALLEADTATFGITDYAQDLLGELVFWDPPQVGETVSAGEPYTELESLKATSAVVAPLSGEIVEVNDAAAQGPEIINDDPYGAGWLVRVVPTDVKESESLLSALGYADATTG